MVLTFFAPLIVAAYAERAAVGLNVGEGVRMALERLSRDPLKPHALDLRRRPREVLINNFLIEAHGLEDLRTSIRFNRRDSHLGHHFDNALYGTVYIALFGFFVGVIVEHPLADHVVEAFECHIGIDRLRTVARQQAEVVHLARFARLNCQTDARARLVAHQVVMDTGHRQQRGNGNLALIDAAIGQDDQVVVLCNRFIDAATEFIHGLFQPGRAVGLIEKDRQRNRSMIKEIDFPQFFKLGVFKDRTLQRYLAAAFRLWIQQVALWPDLGFGRGDQLFAQWIERRIRNLGKVLLKVAEQQLRLVRQRRQCGVISHGAYRILEHLNHRLEKYAQIFERVAEDLLHLKDVCMRFEQGLPRRIRQVL